jgi:hypothetical protein
VHAHPQPQFHAFRQGEGLGPRGDGITDLQGRQRGSPRMILVCHGCAKQRHEAIAEELIDRTLVAMHRF